MSARWERWPPMTTVERYEMLPGNDSISMRIAIADDAPALVKLASLDSAEVPASPVLLAERDARRQAALPLDRGGAVAGPVGPTAEQPTSLALRAGARR